MSQFDGGILKQNRRQISIATVGALGVSCNDGHLIYDGVNRDIPTSYSRIEERKKILIDSSSEGHLPAFAHDPTVVVEITMEDNCTFIHVEGNCGLFFICTNGCMESLMSPKRQGFS